VDSDDLDAIDVDLTEDFAQGFFPQLIAHRRVAPQRPELPQESREDRFGGGRAMSCGRPSMRLGSSKATCSSPARLPAVLLTVPPLPRPSTPVKGGLSTCASRPVGKSPAGRGHPLHRAKPAVERELRTVSGWLSRAEGPAGGARPGRGDDHGLSAQPSRPPPGKLERC
jgi:hypothetical protein